MPQKLRVFLADDHAVVREGLKALIWRIRPARSSSPGLTPSPNRQDAAKAAAALRAGREDAYPIITVAKNVATCRGPGTPFPNTRSNIANAGAALPRAAVGVGRKTQVQSLHEERITQTSAINSFTSLCDAFHRSQVDCAVLRLDCAEVTSRGASAGLRFAQTQPPSRVPHISTRTTANDKAAITRVHDQTFGTSKLTLSMCRTPG
jgi:hypothetical protein